jgi:hypothetical protein
MTYARREEIFSKDYISVGELQELLGYTQQTHASIKMQEIKRVVGDRLGVKGKIHTEDYFEYFRIKADRYSKLIND